MLAQQGRVDDALEVLRGILGSDPGQIQAATLASDLFVQQGRLSDAVMVLRRACEVHPTHDDLAFRLARALAACGNATEAIAVLVGVLERSPNALMPLRLFGQLCFETGQFVKSLQAYTRLAELKPKSPEGHLHRIRCLHTLLMHDDAVTAARDAIELCPTSMDLRLALGQVLYDRGQDEQAIEVYDEVLGAGDHYLALTGKARCVARTMGDEHARALLEKALELSPTETEARRALAAVLIRMGEHEAAAEVLEEALTHAPEGEARGHLCIDLAQCLDKLKRYDEAYDRIEQGHSLIAPSQVAAQFDYGNFVQELSAAIHAPTKIDVASWGAATPDSSLVTPAFLIGFPRSGTTLVEQMIGSLPGWTTSDEKPMLAQIEAALAGRLGVAPSALRESLCELSDEDVAWARRSYAALCRTHLGPEADGLRLLDKQPYNTPRLALIRRIFPEAKVLVAIRDPRDVCLSVIMQDATPNRGMRHYPDIDAVASVYDAMMRLYLADRDRLGLDLLEFRYEDLIDDPARITESISEFLGESLGGGLADHTERARQRRSRINADSVAKPIYKHAEGRWRRYEHRIGHVVPVLDRYLRAFGYL